MTEKEKEVFKQVIDLRDKGVEFIKVEYAGGGDSGSIESKFMYNKSIEKIMWEDDDLEHYEAGHFDYLFSNELEGYIYDILHGIEDWWNNDGGYGTILIRLKDLKYKINNNVYYTQTEHYSHEGGFNLKA
jgi:hypothetical protein